MTQSGAQSGGLCWLRGSRLRARARCTPLPRGPRVRGSDRWVSGHAADLEWAAVSGCVSGTPHSAARQGQRPGACAPWGAPVPRPRSGRAGSAGPRPPPSIPAFVNAVSEGSQAGPQKALRRGSSLCSHRTRVPRLVPARVREEGVRLPLGRCGCRRCFPSSSGVQCPGLSLIVKYIFTFQPSNLINDLYKSRELKSFKERLPVLSPSIF